MKMCWIVTVAILAKGAWAYHLLPAQPGKLSLASGPVNVLTPWTVPGGIARKAPWAESSWPYGLLSRLE